MPKDKEKIQFPKEELKKWAIDITKAAKSTINDVTEKLKDSAAEQENKKLAAKYNKELSVLQPVFLPTLNDRDFSMPDIIHVVEKDKKHSESKACENSIGYLSKENDLPVLNIYPEYLDSLGLTFFPDSSQSIYYVDPYRKNMFIDIQEYFKQMKAARVHELEQLAYSLGAKRVEIVFKTNTVAVEAAKKKAALAAKKGKNKAEVKASHEEKETQKEAIEVASTMELSGHDDPHVPELVYFKNDNEIKSLIFMRMDPKSTLKKKSYSIKYSNSSGIKAADAAKIQGALMQMGGSADVSIMNETLTESNTTLIYEIEF